ncbi:MAG: hypothetical protein M0D55_11240 [Elusimicrobiota bacterium]|nr:MAG: hypothetical protein M0D55_11240 [Elusimicrobiota bacterium]
MDVLLRLRVLIWVLVISLWGVMVYQYLGEEERDLAKMKRIAPYKAPAPPPLAPPPDEAAYAAARPAEVYAPAAALPPGVPSAVPPAQLELGRPPATPPAAPNELGVIPSSEYIGAAPSNSRRTVASNPAVSAVGPASRGPVRPESQPRTAPAHPVREDRESAADMPTPPGFVRSTSRHFVVFAEQYPASERFIELIENLHSNLMLDLAPFSPWASSERTTIFLFKNQDTYRRVTGRPVWSGGASSVTKRKLYVYESEELPGIVAHELTHIYFDGFFLDGTTDPLWLSEGMATLVQVERGLAAPNWLRENLERLEAGDGFPIDKLTAVTSTAGWPDAKVRLWYAQSYSIVRFLIRTQYRSSFYKFSAHLRDGRPAPEALYRAYGAPYTRMVALEHAWRYELSRASMAKLGGQ